MIEKEGGWEMVGHYHSVPPVWLAWGCRYFKEHPLSLAAVLLLGAAAIAARVYCMHTAGEYCNSSFLSENVLNNVPCSFNMSFCLIHTADNFLFHFYVNYKPASLNKKNNENVWYKMALSRSKKSSSQKGLSGKEVFQVSWSSTTCGSLYSPRSCGRTWPFLTETRWVVRWIPKDSLGYPWTRQWSSFILLTNLCVELCWVFVPILRSKQRGIIFC